jgi:hypothetical protein
MPCPPCSIIPDDVPYSCDQTKEKKMMRMILAFFLAAICLPGPSYSISSSGILKKGVWKAGENGFTKIHVCFETQGVSTEEGWTIDAPEQILGLLRKYPIRFRRGQCALESERQ